VKESGKLSLGSAIGLIYDGAEFSVHRLMSRGFPIPEPMLQQFEGRQHDRHA